MAEESKGAPDYLEFIVTSLHKKRKKQSVIEQTPADMPIQKLYETMNTIVSGLDDSINQCKKYNEAKIHRKYEIVLFQQQKRIRYLEEKLRQQQRARSPSKKYIEDLLDKLVRDKFQIEKMKDENSELTAQNAQLKNRLQIYQEHLHPNKQKSHKDQQKMLEQIQPNELSSPSVKNEINSYVSFKKSMRRHESQQKTRFERFLIKVKDKCQNWSLRQLLQNIDKWSIQLVEQVKLQAQIPRTANNLCRQTGLTRPNRNFSIRLEAKQRRLSGMRNLSTNHRTIYDTLLR